MREIYKQLIASKTYPSNAEREGEVIHEGDLAYNYGSIQRERERVEITKRVKQSGFCTRSPLQTVAFHRVTSVTAFSPGLPHMPFD